MLKFKTNIHRSDKALKPITGEVNNTNYLITVVTVAPIMGWAILGSKWTASKVDVLEAEQNGQV